MEEAPRSTRTRPAKAALSREAVIEAALAIIKTEGMDSLSMRRIAQRLDTGAASLYVYVANRDELHDLVFDRIISEVTVPVADKKRWRAQLHEVAFEMVRVYDRYPGSARLAMAKIPTGEGALRVTEAMLALLNAGGISDDAAAYAMDLLSLYITSIAFEQHVRAESGFAFDEDHVEGMRAEFEAKWSALPAEEFPHLTRLAPIMTKGDGDERFGWGLDIMLNGLLATPKPGASPKR